MALQAFLVGESCRDVVGMLSGKQEGIVMSEWQPIETAPKDGTYVMVSNGGGVWVARYKGVFVSGWVPPIPWQSMMLNHDHIPSAKRKGPPTHWMPLPPNP